MRIEGLRIRNYRALRDVTLEDLPSLAVFVGANGVGKSTLFDVFGFLHDALIHNVRQAVVSRGGFKELITRGADGPLEIEIKFRESDGPLVTYQLQIALADGMPIVDREILKYQRGQRGKQWKLLDFRRGKGVAVMNEAAYGKAKASEEHASQSLESPDILAIKALGQFQRFEVVTALRRAIESWDVSSRDEDLAVVAQVLHEKHRDVFDTVLRRMIECVPGIAKIDVKETDDGRVVLRFQDGAFKDPFVARHVSDGTIKMFAQLMLLHDPEPHALLCVEEPENQLYPNLLAELAEDFRRYAESGRQVFVSTHSPSFLNAMALDEIFVMKKHDGITTIARASEDKKLARLAKAGDPPGALWRQGLLAKAGLG